MLPRKHIRRTGANIHTAMPSRWLLVVSLLVVPMFSGRAAVQTVLFRAVKKGNVAEAKALLEAGAAPDAGVAWPWLAKTTPLSEAASQGRADFVHALLAAGARPDAGASIGQEGCCENAG